MYTSTSSFVSTSKKAIFAGLISATVAGATLIGAASPALASTRGWIHEGNTWSYQVSKDTYAKGWYYTPSGKWFYFDSNYKMVTGKLTDDNKDYWLDENAGLLYDRWVQDAKGNWLHTDDNGVLATGWFKTKSGYWFYFNQDHTMKTGILTDRGYTFWLDKKDGLLYNEWVKDSKGNWLHTDGNGCLVKGWYHAPNGKWFYFNDDYTLRTEPLVEKGNRYYFDVNMGLIRTEPLTQGSESANKPSSSSTGKILCTDKNHKPYGATRWVVDKPAWEETKWTATTKYMNGHIISVSTTDPNDLVRIEDKKSMQAWREGKYPSIKTEEEARKEFWTTRLADRGEALNCKYQKEHEFKPGEAGNWTELPLKTETIEHPEQGHWE